MTTADLDTMTRDAIRLSMYRAIAENMPQHAALYAVAVLRSYRPTTLLGILIRDLQRSAR